MDFSGSWEVFRRGLCVSNRQNDREKVRADDQTAQDRIGDRFQQTIDSVRLVFRCLRRRLQSV